MGSLFWELRRGPAHAEAAQGMLRRRTHAAPAPVKDAVPPSRHSGEKSDLSSLLTEEKKVKREIHKSEVESRGRCPGAGAAATTLCRKSCCRKKCFSTGTRVKLCSAATKPLQDIFKHGIFKIPVPKTTNSTTLKTYLPQTGEKRSQHRGSNLLFQG